MLGTVANQFYNMEWQQAAGEGITVLAATGDSGSAGCDPTSFNTYQPAEFGLAVDGTASTPYNVAIGGTDFNDFNNPTTYFSNTVGQITSALGYIPEIPYNDTCTNPVIYGFFGDTSAQQGCNDGNVLNAGLIVVGGGGGGVSNCTTPSGGNPSNCSGGYAEPSWQTGPGVPLDGFRHIPDLSLFAGDGLIQNFYVVCESDLAALEISSPPPPPVTCNLASPYQDFVGEGGTSVAVQAFAGIVALMDQKAGDRQGLINPLLYKLAAGPSASTIFNDITSGTNAMP
jgi:subtilase family serine protease